MVLTDAEVLADLRTLDDWGQRNNCTPPSPTPHGMAAWQLWWGGYLICAPSAEIVRHVAAEIVREAKGMRKLGLRPP